MDDWSVVRDEINTILKQSTTGSNNRWSNATLLYRANKVQARVASGSFCLDNVRYVDLDASIQEYAYGTYTLDVRFVLYHGKPLELMTLEKMNHYAKMGVMNPWRTGTADVPKFWYKRGANIGIGPKTRRDDNGALAIYEWVYPADLTADTSDLFDGASYLNGFVDVVIFYVAEWCLDELGESKSGERDKWGAKADRRYEELKRFSDIRNGLVVEADPKKLRESGQAQHVLTGGQVAMAAGPRG